MLLTGSLGLALAGCSTDDGTAYQSDYTTHQPLRVVGYPSTGSLDVVQKAVWRLADGDAAGLAALAAQGGRADVTARNWVRAFGVAARSEVTADFYDEGSTRQVVVLYFAGSDTERKPAKQAEQIKEIEVRLDGDRWCITLDEPTRSEAAAKPSWAPAEPGGSGSRTVEERRSASG
ncbi:hypothetical protein [Streptomyces sp. NPDC052042]|uniref:hypothetical protein n=1 Tax=Streptomyces sp. NPDC052042 TaxID=3365683 RepID=UPI0037D65175